VFTEPEILPRRALVLAAGEGRRLRPLTEKHPKCLLEVGGRPLLEWALLRLAQAGVTEVTVNLYHLAEQVVAYLEHQPLRELKINLSRESELLGTGGGLYQARRFFSGEEPFYVYNADVYTNLDLRLAARELKDSSLLGILLVGRRPSERRLLFDEHGLLVGWENRRTGDRLLARSSPGEVTPWSFNGIQVLRPEVFQYMSELGRQFSLIEVYLKAVAAGARLKAFPMENAFWADVGTPARLTALRSYLAGDKSKQLPIEG